MSARDRADLEKDKEDGEAKKVSQNSKDDELVEIAFVIVDGNKVEIKEVKTGIQDDDYIQIISGIKDGEEVVSGPYSAVSRKLEDGDEIIIDNEKKNTDEDEDKD
ncbi:MAG: hypothetical protein R2788_16010 [Saprospiraceae bacterium]